VNPLPVVTISGNLEICDGESTILSASIGVAYLWNTGATTRNISVSSAGVFSVIVTDVNGCVGDASVEVIVFELPTSNFEVSETVICYGEPVTFTHYFTGAAPWTVAYLQNGIPSTFTTYENPEIRIKDLSNTTVFTTISVMDGNGCLSFLDQSVTITVNPLPEMICPPYMRAFVNDDPVLLNTSTPLGGVYSGDGVIFDGTDYYFDPSIGIGTYEITYCYTIAATGCQDCCTFSFIVLRVPGDEQIICMPKGWSGISSYFVPDNPLLEYIFDDINAEDKMVIMLDDNNFYWPSQNINTIVNWDVYKGYKIKMNMAACFEISGEMPENKTITVDNGSSFIPVLCDQPIPAEQIFEQLGNSLLFAYDLHSQQLYWPDGGITTLQTLQPGIGYLVNLTQPGQITFNCDIPDIQNFVAAEPVIYEDAPWYNSKTGSNHFISISSSALNELAPGDYIGVFNADGVCSGLTRFNGESTNLLLVAYGNDVTTEHTDGLIENEKMSFRIFRPSTMSEIQTDVTFDLSMPDADFFTEIGQSKIISFKSSAASIVDSKLSSIKMHPNPSNGMINLTIPALDETLKIEVATITGQVIFNESIEKIENTIKHELNLIGVNPGVYFVKISGSNQSIVKKLVIQ
jgi:hypothetical protein